jgi:hypothetical protein
MLQKKSRLTDTVFIVFLYTMLLISSCRQAEDERPEMAPGTELKVSRFERDLFSSDTADIQASLQSLKGKYGTFFDLYSYQITRLGSTDSVLMASRYLEFISDTNFRGLYRECEKIFGDFSAETERLSEAFSNYSRYFKEKEVPRIVTLISVFSYPVIVDSSLLGISLDMYLGTESAYYFSLDPPLPLFLRDRMRKEYLVADAMRGWLEGDYPVDESGAKLIDMMIGQGRLLYATSILLPWEHDTIITGYSSVQLDWCRLNESKIWSFFIDNQMLFSDDPDHLQKFAGEGPSTNGFPKQSPGNIGKFTGWQIVKSYMQNNKDITLDSLMSQRDMMEIFRKSKYKPKK